MLEYYTYSNVVTVQRYYRTSKNRAFSVPPLYKSALTQYRVLCPQARGRASLQRTEHYNRMCRNRGYFPVIFPVRDLTCPDIFIFAQTGADLDRQRFMLTCTLLLLILISVSYSSWKERGYFEPELESRRRLPRPYHFTFLLLCSFLPSPAPTPPPKFKGWCPFSSLLCLTFIRIPTQQGPSFAGCHGEKGSMTQWF